MPSACSAGNTAATDNGRDEIVAHPALLNPFQVTSRTERAYDKHGNAERCVPVRCGSGNSGCTNSEPVPRFKYYQGRSFASIEAVGARCVWLDYIEHAARDDCGTLRVTVIADQPP